MHIRIKKTISFQIYPSSRVQYYGEEIEVCLDKIRWATKMGRDGRVNSLNIGDAVHRVV